MTAFRIPTGLALCGLLLVGCATVHPDFEQYFNAEYQGAENYNESPSHGPWMRLAATRYGCDTMAIRTGVRGYSQMAVGLPPCDIASAIPPGAIRAYKTDKGIREEWRFGSGANTTIVYFEGVTSRTMLVSFIRWY
jgi:hypothetical protein